MNQWKKNMAAAAILVTVCAGIYVNWLYTEEAAASDLTDTLNAEKVMSDETLVLSDDMAALAAGEDIVQTALTEAQIESLIIAKGYTDCVAYMTNEGISVAVSAPEGGLQPADVAVIADIVMSQSDYLLTDIRIVEVS